MKLAPVAAAALVIACAAPVAIRAQTGAPAAPAAQAGAAPAEQHIAWYGTWKDGVAAAREAGRPILLVAAAPQCHNTPGIW